MFVCKNITQVLPAPSLGFTITMSGVVDADYMVSTVYKTAWVLGNTTVPFEGYIAGGWNYMTDTYSEFTIATLFSVILHEVISI